VGKILEGSERVRRNVERVEARMGLKRVHLMDTVERLMDKEHTKNNIELLQQHIKEKPIVVSRRDHQAASILTQVAPFGGRQSYDTDSQRFPMFSFAGSPRKSPSPYRVKSLENRMSPQLKDA